MSNTVKISSKHDEMIEEMISSIEDTAGFRPNKKDVVEQAIEMKYNSNIDE